MPRLTIDNREIDVPPGATLLDAARRLGIDIPTLCHRDGLPPNTSCLVCMVKLADRLVPACGTPSEDGMIVESETDEVHAVRREALELLLSDHLGDCLAPCWFGCPANMDIPLMLRQIAAGQLADAIATVKRDIALPAVLGRICPAPCEKVCRRRQADGAVSICRLKRFVADVDLATGEPYRPERAPDSGRRVAVIGAGSSGLTAAYYLRRLGHACTLIERADQPGGRLLTDISETDLPPEVLRREIDTILALGVELRTGVELGRDVSEERLRDEFDAVLVTFGATNKSGRWQFEADRRTFRLRTSGPKTMVVRSASDGKEVAVAIDQFLGGRDVTGPEKPLNVKMGRLDEPEIAVFLETASASPRREPTGNNATSPAPTDRPLPVGEGTGPGYSPSTPSEQRPPTPSEQRPPTPSEQRPTEAAEQAARCLHCDCRALTNCKLRHWAARYGANPRAHGASERRFVQHRAGGQVIYEPGKCIACGLCIQIAQRAGEKLGLTFIGRGFDVRVGVPLEGTIAEALQHAAAECVEACPTAALAWGREPVE